MVANTNRNGKVRSLTGRATRAGGLSLAKRLLKPIPVIGTVVTLGFAGYEIRKKGWRNGLVHVGLDMTPFVGTAKNVLEFFTGDLIPDKEKRQG